MSFLNRFKKKSKPVAVKAQHIGLLILDALGIDRKNVKSVEADFQVIKNDLYLDCSFTVIIGKCSLLEPEIYNYKTEDMQQLGLDLLKALNTDSTGVTGFRICCPGVAEIATVEITKNIVPDDDQLKLVLSNLKQEA